MNDYIARKRAERLAEAPLVWGRFSAAGGSSEAVVALDFVLFTDAEPAARAAQASLGENYTVTVEPGSQGYWLVKGTTRPYGMQVSEQQHSDWVAYVFDVAASHGAVLSTWTLEAPALKVRVSSEDVEAPV